MTCGTSSVASSWDADNLQETETLDHDSEDFGFELADGRPGSAQFI